MHRPYAHIKIQVSMLLLHTYVVPAEGYQTLLTWGMESSPSALSFSFIIATFACVDFDLAPRITIKHVQKQTHTYYTKTVSTQL